MKKCTLLIFIIMNCQLLFAQQDSLPVNTKPRISHSLQIGYNLGGLTPVPLPNTIRKVERYSPGFSPSFGYGIAYRFNERWSVGATFRFDIKAMHIRDSVQYFHTLITMDSSSFGGDFTGTNNTVCKNIYLSIPINIIYKVNNDWQVKAGLYAAYLIRPSFSGTVSDGYIRKGNSLGEKVMIDHATFNFDKVERRMDWGFIIGGEKKIFKSFLATGDLQCGLRPVFPSSFEGIGFKMTNIFFTLGLKKQL